MWARSAWAGSQRYPLHWGGDSSTSWDNLAPQIAGGLSFKLHPACTLHPARHGARGTSAASVQAIVFEELVLTSQTFARNVSRIEPAWLQELVGASRA